MMKSKPRTPGWAAAARTALTAFITCVSGVAGAGEPGITFDYAGEVVQFYTVPVGVTEVYIQAFGAAGASSRSVGGRGGFAQGFLAVTPGEVLEITVGGMGILQVGGEDPAPGGGGFNGGGHAVGTGQVDDPASNVGPGRGAGGGASDVRQAGSSLDHRVLVAGGGGGSCDIATDLEQFPDGDYPGGDGGGLAGDPGGDVGDAVLGAGGTQDSGGAGVDPFCSPGVKGDGGAAIFPNTCAGGGGGWYGGGGGCGGGGGSSYIGGVDFGVTEPGVNSGYGVVFVAPQAPTILDVEIEIRPGADPNFINVNGAGKLAVAILGSDTFDVADVDVSTLAFGPAAGAPFLWAGVSQQDVGGDANIDLLVHFRIEESGIVSGSLQACVTGEALGGTPFLGCDAIVTLACGLGFELALILPPLAWLRARRRRA